MISKESYTRIFLKQKEKSCDPANIKLHMYKWWQSHRSKKQGGLRLSDEGFEFLLKELDLRSYEVKFTEPIELSPQTIIFLDRYIDCPYYLTNSYITVFSEKKAFELYMFSDDIRKFGLIKAISRQNQSSQTDEPVEENT